MPPTKQGPLGHLQFIRSFQRTRTAERSRKGIPPEGNELSISLIRLAEVYSIENFGHVRTTLQRLFPDLPEQDYVRDQLGRVDEMLRSLNATSWWRIGTLLRDRKGRISIGGPVSVIQDLPVSVDCIEVTLHHILPSTAVLTFDVLLSDNVSVDLNEVQTATYSSEVTLRSLWRWQAGHVEVSAEWIRRRYVRDWLDRLRAGIEMVLKKYLGRGMFGSTGRVRPRLPAVEVYSVHGDADFSSVEWRAQARWWLDSYGIAVDGYPSYRSADALFQWPQNERGDRKVTSHILLISNERYLARIGEVDMYGGGENAIRYHAKERLDGLVSAIVVRRLLEQARRVTEELRQRVFRRIGAGTPGFRLRRLVLPAALHTELLGQSIMLSRLKSEFLREEEWIARSMGVWNELKFAPRPDSEDVGLDRHAVQAIHFEFETVQAHLDLARDAFGKYYVAHNTRAIYWLTVAVVVFTAVQLGVGLELGPWGRNILDSIVRAVDVWLR